MGIKCYALQMYDNFRKSQIKRRKNLYENYEPEEDETDVESGGTDE